MEEPELPRWTARETIVKPGAADWRMATTEFGKVNDSNKSSECGGSHDPNETTPQMVDRGGHAGDEDYAQTGHRAGQIGIRGSRQHLSLPIFDRTKGRLLIEVDSVPGLTISSISVPYDESIGTPISSCDPGTLTCQCDGTGAHRELLGPDARVDTLVAIVVAEDTDREVGWHDLKMPNPGPQQPVPLSGRISGSSKAVDVMSTHDGIAINYDGMYLVMTGPGDGCMLMETCRSIIVIDHAINGEVEPMGRQIYETFLPNEVADNIMMPNAVENYHQERASYGVHRHPI